MFSAVQWQHDRGVQINVNEKYQKIRQLPRIHSHIACKFSHCCCFNLIGHDKLDDADGLSNNNNYCKLFKMRVLWHIKCKWALFIIVLSKAVVSATC